ncbi:MAG: hypothetical protein IT343_21355 [Candidatus Melainabacteria bacterium]|jgi:hypothetical protein|nr:hypothetical protein [Candidatus Melainabacteria bacterium]
MLVVQKLKTLVAAAFSGAIFLAAAAQADTADKVTVVKEKSVVETRKFDHANPGPEVPLKGREAATTHCNYGYDVEVSCQPESSKKTGENYIGTFKVSRVAARLSLPITLWLPDTVNKRLHEHEEGHRQIYEEIYNGADKVAQKQAEAMIGETFIGQGKTQEQAQDDAKRKAAIELNRRYCGEILNYARLVTQLYDNATRSGTNRTPVFFAIRESFLQAWIIGLTRKR